MKKVILPVVALVFSMFLFSSCGADVEKDIVGAWEIESADLSNFDELAQQMGMEGEDLEEMKTQMNGDISDEFVGEVIEFVEDKSVKLGDEEGGEWSYDSKTNIVTIKDGDEEFDMVINKLDGDKLDATMSFEDSGMSFDIAMTLVRK